VLRLSKKRRTFGAKKILQRNSKKCGGVIKRFTPKPPFFDRQPQRDLEERREVPNKGALWELKKIIPKSPSFLGPGAP